MDTRGEEMTRAESRAWESLLVASQLLWAAMDARLTKDVDLALFEYRILAAIHCEPMGIVRIKHLAELTTSTLPRMSKALSRLEARGLIRRSRCAGDARATNVQLTDQGRATLDQAAAAHLDEARHLLLDQLTENQLDQLADLLAPASVRLNGGEPWHVEHVHPAIGNVVTGAGE
ncbi:MAG TPA: MarR family transcriptional regulator [Nakamurella sp.]